MNTTVGEMKLKTGDRVRRADGTGGTVVDSFGAGAAVWVHWDYEPEAIRYQCADVVAWEVVPKPVPTVASLKLAFGDVVRWGGRNWLVRRADAESVCVVDPGGYVFTLTGGTPIPEGFVRVQT